MRGYYLDLLQSKNVGYILDNNLYDIYNWLIQPTENNFIKSCIRASDRYQQVIYDEEVIYDFLNDYKESIENEISLYEEQYIYTEKELKEIYQEQFENDVIDLIDKYNDFVLNGYELNFESIEVFNCLRSYIEEKYRFESYPHRREMVYLNKYKTEEEQKEKSYLDMTIEDVMFIARQNLWKCKII